MRHIPLEDRMVCCICFGGTADALDYLEVELHAEAEIGTGKQVFGAHGACLQSVLHMKCRIEILEVDQAWSNESDV
jgi:hypothetical protein